MDDIATLDLSVVLRALRSRADMSQRQLAAHAGLAQSQVARLESGDNRNPRLRTLQQVITAAGARLAVVHPDGTEPQPTAGDDRRDGAMRRYPAHLDVSHDPQVGCTFRRDRRARDEIRRDRSGQRRYLLFTEIRLLGPGDLQALRSLYDAADELDLADRPPPAPPVPPAPDDDASLRYLRDPALRHWIAENGHGIQGHLVAHLQRRYAGPPALMVTDFGLRREHRTDLVGPHLAAALCDEAHRLGVGDILVLADHRRVAGHLRQLGFRPVPKGHRLLTV